MTPRERIEAQYRELVPGARSIREYDRRPAVVEARRAIYRELRDRGYSWGRIARAVGREASTIRHALRKVAE